MKTLDLHISQDGPHFRAQAFTEGAQHPRAEGLFDFLLSSVTDFGLRRLDRRGGSSKERLDTLAGFGKTLFAKLFAGELADIWSQHGEEAELLNVRLQFSESAAALEAVPWETLHDGHHFVAAGERSTLTRLPANAVARQNRRPLLYPVRMLGVFASPLDLAAEARLDIEREEKILLEAIDRPASQSLVEVAIEDEAKVSILHSNLAKGCDLLHFTGHGISPHQGGGLLLEDEKGNQEIFPPEGILALLNPERTGLQLVVLSTCFSARSSTIGESYSLLRMLSANGVPHAVAMAFPILDLSGLAFAERFYAEIFAGAAPEVAIHRTRRALLAHENPEIRPDALALVYQGIGGELIAPGAPRDHGRARPPSQAAPTPGIEVFYGRRREARRLRDEICGSQHQGILISGMGGVGKTSLVSHVLERLPGRFHNLHLDAARGEASPELIVLGLHRLRDTVGSSFESLVHGMSDTRQRLEATCAALRAEPALVVLDNFEALLAPAALPGRGQALKDPSLEEFLRGLCTGDIGTSKLIFLSRHPFELGRAGGAPSEIRLADLSWPEALGLMQTKSGLSALSRERRGRSI